VCFKGRTDNHKWKQNTPVKKKNWKARKSKQQKQKTKICTVGASENLMPQIPWETEK
jgi:hypothetical protein